MNSSTRHSEDWITQFAASVDKVSPPLFSKWAGIAALAGVLERKVWIDTVFGQTFPHLYTLIIAPSGVGKSAATRLTRQLWQEMPDHRVCPASVNFATMIDELREAMRSVITTKEVVTYNSLKICANEFGVLLPAYDTAMMAKLTDIYDAGEYGERRRNSERNTFNISNPQINLIGATTPSYLKEQMPEGAWEQGFLSRCIIVFHGTKTQRKILGKPIDYSAEFDKLRDDLLSINNVYGAFEWENSAADSFEAWNMEDCPPKPDHPKLETYCTRRPIHMLKLLMISSISRNDELIITQADFDRALEWLLEVEIAMPQAFLAMQSNSDGQIMQDLHFIMRKNYIKNKQPIKENALYLYLQNHVPGYAVPKIIEIMEKSKMIKSVTVKNNGRCYEPLDYNSQI